VSCARERARERIIVREARESARVRAREGEVANKSVRCGIMEGGRVVVAHARERARASVSS